MTMSSSATRRVTVCASGAQTSKLMPEPGAPRDTRPAGRRAAPSHRRAGAPVRTSRHGCTASTIALSCQPPSPARPMGRSVATVTAPPRSNARAWSAPRRRSRAGGTCEQVGPITAEAQRTGGDQQLRCATGVHGGSHPSSNDVSRARRSAKSTGRRLSGSTNEVSHSSLPWYTSGIPGEVSWISLRPSPLLHPAARVASTRSSTTARTATSSNAASTIARSRCFEVVVRVGPRRRRARLAGRLLGVGVQPLAGGRPRADDRLPDEQLQRAVAQPVQLAQPAHGVRPPVGDLGAAR